MSLYSYDKTFEGFLTLVFDAYEKKIEPTHIVGKDHWQQCVFTDVQHVVTDEKKGERVWTSIQKKLSKFGCNSIYYAFLSELDNVEVLLFKYMQKIFSFKGHFEYNFSDIHVIELEKIRKKVVREGHRMLMFVRFQKTSDELFYCGIEPKYNVLPLVTKHFAERFADQKWVIYDTKRKYGFYYDLKEPYQISFDETSVIGKSIWLPEQVIHAEEKLFQNLWREYFHALTIKERINPKLHMQHLPKRFWKYLPEKMNA